MKHLVGSLVVLTMFLSGIAFASRDHTGGAVDTLVYDASQLEQMVRYSPLNYSVKDAVSRFNYDVERLGYCADHSRDHDGCPAACKYDLYNAQESFRPVSRYLYDTQYEYPQIYNQYRRTQYSLSAVQVDQAPTMPVKCVAVDSGWEEHFGGHAAYGNSLYEAQNNATRECRRYHGSCRIQSCQ